MANAVALNIQLSQTSKSRLRNLAGQFAKSSEVLDLARSRISTVAYRALSIAQNLAPRDTGAFASGLSLMDYGTNGFAIVSNNPFLLQWLREGTGVYAGKGRITPVNARAMVFTEWRGAMMAANFRGAYAFTSIAGMAANPWEMTAQFEIKADLDAELPRIAYDWAAFLGGSVR